MSEDVIEAYDVSFIELIWIKNQVEKALEKSMETLRKKRLEAIKKKVSKP